MSGYVHLVLILVAALSLIAYRVSSINKAIEETAPDCHKEES